MNYLFKKFDLKNYWAMKGLYHLHTAGALEYHLAEVLQLIDLLYLKLYVHGYMCLSLLALQRQLHHPESQPARFEYREHKTKEIFWLFGISYAGK